MAARSLNGAATADAIRAELAPAVAAYARRWGRPPALHLVLVGTDPASQIYVRGKEKSGREAGLTVSVCGDAAADPRVLPLLVGLDVDTLSVPAARVPRVRSWVADLDAGACADLAARALAAPTVDAVWKLVPAL